MPMGWETKNRGKLTPLTEPQMVQAQTVTVDQALQQAIAHHQAGRLQEAERLYRAILQVQPNHPDANHNLGVLALQMKRPTAGVPHFKTALEASPERSQYWLSYIDALIQAGQTVLARQIQELGLQKGLSSAAMAAFAERLDQLENIAPSEVIALDCAYAHREAGRYKEAVSILQSWLASNPHDAGAYASLAQVLSLDKQDEAAWGALSAAQSINPALPIVLRNYARLLLKQQKAGAALQVAQNAYQSDASDPENQLVLAAALGANNQNEQAFQQIASALRSRPDYAEAFVSRALLKLRGSDLVGALSDAERALAIKPHLGQLWGLVSSLRYQLQNLPGAMAALENALDFEPENVGHLANLGEFKRRVGSLEAATALLEKATVIEPSNAGAWVNLGTVLQECGRVAEAKSAYAKALEIAPGQAEVASNLGALAKDEDQWEEALCYFDQALVIQPELAEAHSNMGSVLRKLGRLGEAEASCRRALEIQPELAEAHNNLGGILRNLGRFGEAEASFQRALDKKSDLVEAHSNLGWTLQAQGRLEDAQTSYRKMLEIRSDYVHNDATTPVTALFPFGRSGSLFFHSLFDGHPEIATLPGVYFKGWFGMDHWKRFAPNPGKPDWRESLVESILKEYQPLFDASCKKNVAGKPFGKSSWLARDLGFTEMGVDRSQSLMLNQNAFAQTFLSLLAPLPSIGSRECFELVHRAFEVAIRGNTACGSQKSGPIFYHIHNPDPFELAHFLQHYPQARLLYIMRNPVQGLESFMLAETESEWSTATLNVAEVSGTGSGQESKHRISCWNKAVGRVDDMFSSAQSPFHSLPRSRGVRLEDVKRDSKRVMPQIAAWMGISDHQALYEASFCGVQYWGPASKVTGKITGFDTKAIDRPVGRLLGPRDVKIFETLFWPLSRQYGYTELDAAGFRRQLGEIRAWLDEPLEFEMTLYSELSDSTLVLQDLPPYIRLHRLLQHFWSLLDRNGIFHGMVQPLELK